MNHPLSLSHFESMQDTMYTPPLVDGFLRQLTYLRLSVTDFCNFRCNYCLPNGYQGKRPDDELTLDEIDTLIHAFAHLGTQKVRLTGGEPSIRRDISDIITHAKHTNGIRKVAMTSNGYKLGKHLQHWHQAGLDQLNLSVDSFQPDVFKKITGFDILPQLLKDVDLLLSQTDIRLKMNAILMAETAYDTLIDALNYIKDRPISFRFIEFMQTSDNAALFFAQHAQTPLISQYLIRHGWQIRQREQTDGPAVEYQHPDYLGRIGIIAPYSPKFCQSCNRLRVSSQGKIHLCLFDRHNYDIRPYLQHNNVEGLIDAIQALMPIKPEHHHLQEQDSGLMHNLSLIGG